MRACCVCGALHPVEELTEFDDYWLCSSCLRTETILCQDCAERIWADANAGDSNTPLCQRCYDRNYTSCEDCGRVLHHNDAYASTEEILKKAMLQAQLRLGKAEKVNLFSGELMWIDARGKITRSHFDDSRLYSAYSFPWPKWDGYETVKRPYADDSNYLEDLKSVAVFYGLYPEDIDALIVDGMDPMEIEELLYCG